MKARTQIDPAWSPVRELRESFFLIALTASSLSAYVGLGLVAVRLISAVR